MTTREDNACDDLEIDVSFSKDMDEQQKHALAFFWYTLGRKIYSALPNMKNPNMKTVGTRLILLAGTLLWTNGDVPESGTGNDDHSLIPKQKLVETLATLFECDKDAATRILVFVYRSRNRYLAHDCHSKKNVSLEGESQIPNPWTPTEELGAGEPKRYFVQGQDKPFSMELDAVRYAMAVLYAAHLICCETWGFSKDKIFDSKMEIGLPFCNVESNKDDNEDINSSVIATNIVVASTSLKMGNVLAENESLKGLAFLPRAVATLALRSISRESLSEDMNNFVVASLAHGVPFNMDPVLASLKKKDGKLYFEVSEMFEEWKLEVEANGLLEDATSNLSETYQDFVNQKFSVDETDIQKMFGSE